MATKVYCKFYQQECQKLVSQSSANPSRQYYSCPVSFENGGHGFMHWVDNVPSRSSSNMVAMTVEQAREQVALCEAKLRLSTLKKDKHQQKASLLKDELAMEKEKTKCLTKCLKGLGLLFFVVLLSRFFGM